MDKMPTNSLGKSSELKLHCLCLFDAYSMPKDMCSAYSLISIRQNYIFDMLATIWHEIVNWFLEISQDLQEFAQNVVVVFFIYQCITILWSQQTRTGKTGESHKSTNNAM